MLFFPCYGKTTRRRTGINIRYIGEEPELATKVKAAAAGRLEFDTEIRLAPSSMRGHHFNPGYEEMMRHFS